MILLGLYSDSIFSIGQRAEQTPQEKHFLMCSPPNSRATRCLKLGSNFFKLMRSMTAGGSPSSLVFPLKIGQPFLLRTRPYCWTKARNGFVQD